MPFSLVFGCALFACVQGVLTPCCAYRLVKASEVMEDWVRAEMAVVTSRASSALSFVRPQNQVWGEAPWTRAGSLPSAIIAGSLGVLPWATAEARRGLGSVGIPPWAPVLPAGTISSSGTSQSIARLPPWARTQAVSKFLQQSSDREPGSRSPRSK